MAGVWHAAGILADGLLRGQTASSIKRVYAPKACGAFSLQQACATSALDTCVMFSSIAALVGGGGQTNYAAANYTLDSLGACRRKRGQAAASIQWGPWADVGMAASESINARLQSMGIGLITFADALSAFVGGLTPRGNAVYSLYMLKWSKFLGGLPEVPPLLTAFAKYKKTAGAAVAASTEKKAVSMDFIIEAIRQTTGGKVDPDAPLMEAGLDSLGSVELGNQLQAESGQSLPSHARLRLPDGAPAGGLLRRAVRHACAGGETAAAAAAAVGGADGPPGRCRRACPQRRACRRSRPRAW